MSDTLKSTTSPATVYQAPLIPLPEEAPAVAAFINERPRYVTAIHTAIGDDYARYTGHAAARRQLAEALGWTVPHEPGEVTTMAS